MRFTVADNLKLLTKTLALVGGIFIWNTPLTAQQQTIPLNRFIQNEVERVVLRDSTIRQTGFKPLLEKNFDLTKVTGYQKDSMKVYEPYQKYLFLQHLVTIKKDDYYIAIDPVFNFMIVQDFADKSVYSDSLNLYVNTRGLQVIGDIGKKVSFHTSFYENQTYLPLYQKAFADSTQVMPGMGRWKRYKFLGFDYAMAQGWVSYSPAKWVNLQFGNGKQFVGHGYRSILLSDAAFTYPYIKASLQFLDGKLQYHATYASLQTLERLPLGEVPESLFKRKGASFNYLSWMPNQRVELGVFESVIWERYGSNGTMPQAMGAYIPIIGVNSVNLGFDSRHNILLGANAKLKLTKHAMVYGQFASDHLKRKTYGYQLGAKYYDLILPKLDVQLEWNNLSRHLYADATPIQSYTHFNQPLGHPSGPATNEVIGIVNYRYKRRIAQIKYNHITHQLGPEGNWRTNPQNVIGDQIDWPNKQTQQVEIAAGFYVNPKTNFQILAIYTYRTERTNLFGGGHSDFNTNMLGVAVRTNLINLYNDF